MTLQTFRKREYFALLRLRALEGARARRSQRNAALHLRQRQLSAGFASLFDHAILRRTDKIQKHRASKLADRLRWEASASRLLRRLKALVEGRRAARSRSAVADASLERGLKAKGVLSLARNARGR